MSAVKADPMSPALGALLGILGIVVIINLVAQDWGDALDGASIMFLIWAWDQEQRRANAYKRAYLDLRRWAS